MCTLLPAFEKSLIMISILLPKSRQKKIPWYSSLLSATQISCYTNLCARLLSPHEVFNIYIYFIINSQSKTEKNWKY